MLTNKNQIFFINFQSASWNGLTFSYKSLISLVLPAPIPIFNKLFGIYPLGSNTSKNK